MIVKNDCKFYDDPLINEQSLQCAKVEVSAGGVEYVYKNNFSNLKPVNHHRHLFPQTVTAPPAVAPLSLLLCLFIIHHSHYMQLRCVF